MYDVPATRSSSAPAMAARQVIVRAAEIPLLRLAAQRLAGERFTTPTQAVRWMTAQQGQDYRGVVLSIALRTRDATRATVESAFDAGEIVRSWPMRGTLHVVPAEDLGWMLDVAGARIARGAATRWAGLGLDEETRARARDVAIAELSGGRRSSRDGLFAIWEKAGIATTGQRGVHLILGLALTATVCFGPIGDGAQQLVLYDEWAPQRRRLAHDEALGEWAGRFFRSHGPATLADFARWTKLPLGECRRGVAVAAEALERLEVDGIEHWMDPATPSLLAQCRDSAEGLLLLPGFDEYVLGYADRTTILPADFAERVVPGNNGVFQPTVIVGGQVVGTWRRVRRRSGDTVSLSSFRPRDARLTRGVKRAFTDVTARD